MTAARVLLALIGLVPLVTAPLEVLTVCASAADIKPADAKVTRVPAGEAVGHVAKVSSGQITVKVAETVVTPAHPRTVTIMNQRVAIPQYHTKTVHKELTYGLDADVSVKAASGPAGTSAPTLKDVRAGDPVRVYLSRTSTPTGAPLANPVVTRIDVGVQSRK